MAELQDAESSPSRYDYFHRHQKQGRRQEQQHLSGTQILFGAAASLALGGPLLGTMGCDLLASTILLLVAAPLLLLLSPVLLTAAFVVVASVVGFGLSAVMALLGLSAFRWALRCVRQGGPYDVGKIVDMLTLSGHRVKEKSPDFEEHHGQYVSYVIPSEKGINGGM
ncbi:unnamed protein product [Musa hybrid cultivar]